MIRCKETENRSAELITELLPIWENSVKATHLFLSKKEIERIKRYLPQALREVPHLLVAEEGSVPVAFAGIDGQKLTMLFVSVAHRGKRIGERLLKYAIASMG